MSLDFNTEMEQYILKTEYNCKLLIDRFKIKYNIKKKYHNFFELNNNKLSKLQFELHFRQYFLENNLQINFNEISIDENIANLFNLDKRLIYNLEKFIICVFHLIVEKRFTIEI